jgi:hypothetical protein
MYRWLAAALLLLVAVFGAIQFTGIVAVRQFIDQATPLALALILGLVGFATAPMTKSQILTEQDADARLTIAKNAYLDALAPNLCLASFSFDIWAVTTLFAADPKVLDLYNLTGKQSAISTLLAAHVLLFVVALIWGPLVRRNTNKGLSLEISVGSFAVIFCILFQVY